MIPVNVGIHAFFVTWFVSSYLTTTRSLNFGYKNIPQMLPCRQFLWDCVWSVCQGGLGGENAAKTSESVHCWQFLLGRFGPSCSGFGVSVWRIRCGHVTSTRTIFFQIPPLLMLWCYIIMCHMIWLYDTYTFMLRLMKRVFIAIFWWVTTLLLYTDIRFIENVSWGMIIKWIHAVFNLRVSTVPLPRSLAQKRSLKAVIMTVIPNMIGLQTPT